MTDYESEFTVPVHTKLEQRNEGLRRITTVILDGAIVDFEFPEGLARACDRLKDEE